MLSNHHAVLPYKFILLCNAVITLCTYAQQGYAFGRIGLYVCIYIFICMSTKNRLLITALLTASACAALCKSLLKQVDKNLYKRFLLEFIDK